MTEQHLPRRESEASPFVSWSLSTDGQTKRRETRTATETTQPIPLFFLRMQQAQWNKPTITQLRYVCGMGQYELAVASGVRYCRVWWIERGIGSSRTEIDKILAVLSSKLRTPYTIEDCQGVKVNDRDTVQN